MTPVLCQVGYIQHTEKNDSEAAEDNNKNGACHEW